MSPVPVLKTYMARSVSFTFMQETFTEKSPILHLSVISPVDLTDRWRVGTTLE